MTDSRLIACAKAMNAAPYVNREEIMVTLARACILEWHQQPPSDGVIVRGDEAIIEALKLENLKDAEPTPAQRAYTAMCAQAAKEIA